MTWSPQPEWEPILGTHGPSTVGVWTWSDAVIKRIAPGDLELPPSHVGYWRREAEVALAPETVAGPGLAPPQTLKVEEDPGGVTIWSRWVETSPLPALVVAEALGAFAGTSARRLPWMSLNLLRDRLAISERRGGWTTLGQTTLDGLCTTLWERREYWLRRMDEAPAGRLHGDPTPSNFLAREGDRVLTIDWQCFGYGPVGTDLGYWALSSRQPFDSLLEAFCVPGIDGDSAAMVARVMLAYTALSRAELALSHVAVGNGAVKDGAVREGDVTAKLKHPSVAPHLRALQRNLPTLELVATAT